MCNCNQNRAAVARDSVHSPRSVVKVMLVENTPVSINGNYTGRTYRFKNINDINWVDKRDIPAVKDIKGLQIFD
jgi:hypothetical protein